MKNPVILSKTHFPFTNFSGITVTLSTSPAATRSDFTSDKMSTPSDFDFALSGHDELAGIVRWMRLKPPSRILSPLSG